ncbi:integration host factor, actinobacterial type [Changpingibacter yushuensis]|uniref:integration host factor, actinobacterial type n=1 Tax=Changpingibacter yushuensis TaxID=2758440 RepID=UPI0015F71FDD|nr:integration host factor, actinobacterial type [Changpingibacter yushuensis]
MALPALTVEQRAAALEKASIARQRRAELKRDLKEGKVKLSEVLEMAKEDEVVAKLRVTALLSSMPGIGAAKSQHIMEQCQISESRRVAGLGRHQKEALIERFG